MWHDMSICHEPKVRIDSNRYTCFQPDQSLSICKKFFQTTHTFLTTIDGHDIDVLIHFRKAYHLLIHNIFLSNGNWLENISSPQKLYLLAYLILGSCLCQIQRDHALTEGQNIPLLVSTTGLHRNNEYIVSTHMAWGITYSMLHVLDGTLLHPVLNPPFI